MDPGGAAATEPVTEPAGATGLTDDATRQGAPRAGDAPTNPDLLTELLEFPRQLDRAMADAPDDEPDPEAGHEV